ncbi:RecX family transcriptional regulator [Facklamia sp. DSM 111018]|uniref:Regulatory protein RecX n=1 Tax=Facklamia lactis TaxID=2749967 RepID=A0ABS0LPV8_9LACT|nr:RecX family transcriptional regulator [Facklamia lactis]MBG9986108.1 RecX family transcriptional regulator [Facklamia lactis]
MQISKIERQKKNPQRYSVFLNNQFAFGVDEQVLINFNLRKGQELNQNDIYNIQKSEYEQSVYHKALNYLSHGLKSELEVRQYIKQQLEKEEISWFNLSTLQDTEPKAMKSRTTNSLVNKMNTEHNVQLVEAQDFPQVQDEKTFNAESLVDSVLERLISLNLVNDKIFGEAFTRTQATINYKGPTNIKFELLKKGLNEFLIEDILQIYTEEMMIKNIETLSQKFIQRKAKLPFKMQKIKLQSYLIQKGYPKEFVQTFLNDYQIEQDESHEKDLLKVEAEKLLARKARKYQGFDLKYKLSQDLQRKGFDYQEIQYWLEDHIEEIK